MATAIISQFDGGHAESVRSSFANECESCENFDIFTDPKKLQPFPDTVAETMTSGTVTDFAITDVDSFTVVTDVSLVGLGRTSLAVNTPAFFRKSSTNDLASGWQYYASGTGTVVAGTLRTYKNYAFCISSTGTTYTLQRFDGISTVTNLGTLTGFYNGAVSRPFIHPTTNLMYVVAGNYVSSYNLATGAFVPTALTIPLDDKYGVSLTFYGNYLVIVCRPKSGSGNSVCFLWDQSTVAVNPNEAIDLGESQVNIVENIANNIVAVSTRTPVGQYPTITSNKIIVKEYIGGAMQVTREIPISLTLGTSLNYIKRKVDDKVYFAFPNDTSVYVFGKNKSGRFFVSHNRALPSATTTIKGLSIIGDIMWISFDTQAQSNQFQRTKVSTEGTVTYNNVSSYTTLKNPDMVEGDKDVIKQLQGVQMSVSSPAASGTSVLEYSVDGSAYVQIASVSNTMGDFAVEAMNETTDTDFLAGREYQFRLKTTGGACPFKLRYRYINLNQLV